MDFDRLSVWGHRLVVILGVLFLAWLLFPELFPSFLRNWFEFESMYSPPR